MILHRSALSSRRYRSDESDPVPVEVRWSRSLGGFRRDGVLTVGDQAFELRTAQFEVWLVEDEESIAYARGSAGRWELAIGDRDLLLTQPAIGRMQSTLAEGETVQGEIRSADKLLRKVLVNLNDDFSATQQAFVAAIAIRGWRETLAGMSQSADEFA